MITLEYININESIYNLCTKYPKLKDALYDLGFDKIKNPIMFNTISKFMTINNALKMKDIDIKDIKDKLNEYGFDIGLNTYIKNTDKTIDERNEVLKSLIVRLHNGENIDSIKIDFEKKLFKVSAEEVHNAMHELINSGMSIDEAKRFFYIRTLLLRDAIDNCNITNNYNIINIFKKENRYIEKLLNDISSINILYKKLSRHYYKKESILFKALKSYGNDEPSKVMTRVDKDILESLKYIIDSNLNSDDLKEKYEEINASILDMIFKEENILIPLCIDTLSKEDFEDIESKYSKNS
ncbi:DUF438 domain-containing protein [Brachyspira murdochii]|uniref:DUF438 domain-containing protein n=1 Tax=Brachyspira murdochii (strain ATCC 51284 / DSM 12563 / 56-150) TaxID=526224 RepID=D5U9T2_BRAM5|nr:DUF438 domain-containing protein [Brachyspira murdochii]ADG71455.1 Domain of unknown function DUF1858 [Brachyspira murdochii DSM 12563]